MMIDDNPKKSQEEKITYINTWFKIILISAISGVVLYKILISQINLSAFDFSDLLSLILAIFAIALSVMFYYKATDTSNLFYDNTYRFTRDTSTILGRIEAGFGERLRHLDEGYSGLRDVIYKPASNDSAAEEKIEEGEKKIENVLKEREGIIQDLLEKAKLKELEEKEVKRHLEEKDKELENARRLVRNLKERLESSQLRPIDENINMNRIKDRFRLFLIKNILSEINPSNEIVPSRILIERFNDISEFFNSEWLEDGRRLGLISENSKLTDEGVKYFQSIIHERRIKSRHDK